jgi:phosphohistidine phosphatase
MWKRLLKKGRFIYCRNIALMPDKKQKTVQEKTLIVVRHAKSSWEKDVASDFDRPLNDRGKRDAPEIAEKIFAKGYPIDAFVSSPALRALSTAELFSAAWKFPLKKIIQIPELYHASPDTLFRTVESLDDRYETVAVFSHNPGITEFVNLLLEGMKMDNMPTCGAFAVRASIGHWSDFRQAEKSFLFFYQPSRH